MLILLPYTGSTSSSCDIRQRNHWSCHSPFTKFGTSISWEVKRHTVRHTDSFRGNYLKRKITLASYQTYSVEMLNWLVPCPWGRFLADGRGNVSWSPDLFRPFLKGGQTPPHQIRSCWRTEKRAWWWRIVGCGFAGFATTTEVSTYW